MRKMRIECLEPFKDGNILDTQVAPGEEIVVPANKWAQIKRSAPGSFVLLGEVVPSSIPDIQDKVVAEAVSALEGKDEAELARLLEQEKKGKDRKTVKGAIKDAMESVDG